LAPSRLCERRTHIVSILRIEPYPELMALASCRASTTQAGGRAARHATSRLSLQLNVSARLIRGETRCDPLAGN
jgi:hypothetical protein